MQMRMRPLNNEIITPEMMQIKSMIIDTFVQRDAIKNEMEHWYDINPGKHFPKMKELVVTDATLSKLDSFYKQLWDYHNAKPK
jgi:hypothetical protein